MLVRLVQRRAALSCAVFAFLVVVFAPFMLVLRSHSAARTTAYGSAAFDYEVTGPLDTAAVASLHFLAERGSLVTFLSIGGLRLEANGATAPGISLYVAREGNPEQSWFSDGATLERGQPSGPWIDISASVAEVLNTEVGDRVAFSIAGAPKQALEVRRIVGVHLKGARGVATAMADAVQLPAAVNAQAATTAVFNTSKSRSEVERALVQAVPFGFDLVSRSDQLARLQDSERPHQRRMLVAQVLALVGLAVVGFREGMLAAAEHRRAVVALIVLGVRRLWMVGAMVAVHASALFAISALGLAMAKATVFPRMAGFRMSPQTEQAATFMVAFGLSAFLAFFVVALLVVTRVSALLRTTTGGRVA